MTDSFNISHYRPASCGWLRRPEFEKPGSTVEAWERPDGRVFLHDLKNGPLVLTVVRSRVVEPHE